MSRLQGEFNQSFPDQHPHALEGHTHPVPQRSRCQCDKPWCGHAGRCGDNARWLRFDGTRLCEHCARMRVGNGVELAQYYERLEA